jgi:diguanylate cyclase (GGDEF)-like protein
VAWVVAIGVAVSVTGALVWRDSVRHSERQTFQTASTDVAETTEALVGDDAAFVTSLRTALTEQPDLTAGRFSRWFSELEGNRRELGAFGTLVVREVPAGRLPAFEAARDAEPAFRRLVGGHVSPVTLSRTPYYCLLAAGAGVKPFDAQTAALLEGNWCEARSAIGGRPSGGGNQARHMRELASSGDFLVYPIAVGGVSTFFIEAAFYSVGAQLATAAERLAAVRGWVASSFSVPALARTALEPHDGLSLTLYHSNPGEPQEPIGHWGHAAMPDFTSSTTIGLAGSWLARVAGAEPGPALSADLQGATLAAVGLLLTALLVALVLVLTRSREHALGLVDQRTVELRHQALYDALTGLPNRVLALDRARHMLARARREQVPVAALYIDVDGFKQVNDTFGHAAGDEFLRIFAERLQSVVREGDTAARLGGDEFVVLVEGASLAGGPELVAERVLDMLRRPYELGGDVGRELTLTASIGVASGPRHTADELLRDADLALYQAKAGGRNRYMVFESTMQAVASERTELEMDLVGALARGELFLLYQPTVSLQAERVIGAEALIRWRHPKRGVIAPDRFIPLAEDSGLVVAIGAWVLREACRQTAAWRAGGHELSVAVNVSGRQLDTTGLLDDVRSALASSGLEPRNLTLEITETALMHDPMASAEHLRALKRLGVRIAIDDFGTGYSSLAYLRQFPADTLKIDRSFVSTIAHSERSTAIVHTLVELGSTLNIQTLAEGIETVHQLHILQQEGCDEGQGFLFSRPLPADAVETFLDRETLLPSA